MKIKRTYSTPEIIFDKDNCELTFRGASFPEDANLFYEPIRQNIKEFFIDLNGSDKKVKITCEFTMLNSVSTRYIYEFLREADMFSNQNNTVNIKWYYEYDDEDMGVDGEVFKHAFKKLNFDIIPVKDIDNIVIP